jgi:Holliday junction resolvase RusA-like endonuclease
MYDAWISECAWRLRAQNAPQIAGPILILVGVERTNKRADIDNRIKALFDVLVSQGVIEDDSKIVGFAAAWSPARDGLARVAIMPAANLDVQFQLASDGAHGGWFLHAPQSEEGEA